MYFRVFAEKIHPPSSWLELNKAITYAKKMVMGFDRPRWITFLRNFCILMGNVPTLPAAPADMGI
jgi:hypothetical protein